MGKPLSTWYFVAISAEVVSLTGFPYKPAPKASWRSGYAEDCKSLHPGSIPGEASNPTVDILAMLAMPRLAEAEAPRLVGVAPVHPRPQAHRQPPLQPPHRRKVDRQYRQAKRHHPEAENRQETENAANHQQARPAPCAATGVRAISSCNRRIGRACFSHLRVLRNMGAFPRGFKPVTNRFACRMASAIARPSFPDSSVGRAFDC